MKTDWDKVFCDAHLHSWPTSSLSMHKDIFKRDNADVLRAAKLHGYEMVSAAGASQISFVRNPRRTGPRPSTLWQRIKWWWKWHFKR